MTLIVTLAVCSLAVILSPEGERGIFGYIKLSAGICVLCVAISPISSFVGSLYSLELDFDMSDKNMASLETLENIYEDMLREASGVDISEKLSVMICRDLGIDREDVGVFVETIKEGGVSKVKKVSVVLSGKAVFSDPRKISEYVASVASCECEIVYK